MTTPEFLVVNAMAVLDLPVLLGPSGLDIAMPDARRLEGAHDRERKFHPVVALELPNRERHRRLHLAEEIEAGVLILSRIEAAPAQPRAIVQYRVQVDRFASKLHDLDVDLHRFAGVRPSRTASVGAVCGEAVS
jgi:hypothetical protein